MNQHLVRLRSRARASRSIAPPHPRDARGGAAQVAEALGAPLHTKLTLGAPDDAQEREADAVADRVMRMPDGSAPAAVSGEHLQRKCAACEEEESVQRQASGEEEEEEVQRQANGEEEEEEVQRQTEGEEEEEEVVQAKADNAPARPVAADTAARIQSARGRGQPLPASEQAFFGPRLGADVSRVRVHDDAGAAQLNRKLGAHAFTVGSDVFFARGQYRPGTSSGRHLLAHELTHVMQQGHADTVRRTIDWVDVDAKKKRIDMYLSLGIYGSLATSSLARKWRNAIARNWSGKLKYGTSKIDARMHVTGKAYPTLPDSQPVDGSGCPKLPNEQFAHIAIDESNAIQVIDDSCGSVVDYRCDWGFDNYSCGRWAKSSPDLIVAHEAGHLMGLIDRYTATPGGSVDNAGFEKDIMANVWNDNGKTDFSRAWVAAMIHFYTGVREKP